VNRASTPSKLLKTMALEGRQFLQGVPLKLMNAVATPATMVDLEYGPEPRQRLDLYLHSPNKGTPPRGTILFIHGGYWDSGDKSDYGFMADAILRMGFHAALMNYRLPPQSIFPDFVTDAALAVRWLHENLKRFGIEGSPIGLLGHSAGAHIAALLCCTPDHMSRVGASRDLIAAGVGMSGPYDFLDWIPGDARMQAAFGSADTWAQTQPVLLADGLNPPLLLLHGERDMLCTPLHAPALRDAIVQKGGEATYLWYPKLDHFTILGAFSRIARWLEPRVVEDVKAFFETQFQAQSVRTPPSAVSPREDTSDTLEV
jgi:acetyl esterase/lipase